MIPSSFVSPASFPSRIRVKSKANGYRFPFAFRPSFTCSNARYNEAASTLNAYGSPCSISSNTLSFISAIPCLHRVLQDFPILATNSLLFLLSGLSGKLQSPVILPQIVALQDAIAYNCHSYGGDKYAQTGPAFARFASYRVRWHPYRNRYS